MNIGVCGEMTRLGTGEWTIETEGAHVYSWGSLVLVVYGTPPLRPGGPGAEELAESWRARYLEQGEWDVRQLGGACSLALFDGQAGRTVLYRSLGGPALYYRSGPDSFRCASLPVRLVGHGGETPTLCRDALPGLFLQGRLTGRTTLFADCLRLLPGEEVSWDAGTLRIRQRRCLTDLFADGGAGDDAANVVRHVMFSLTTAHPSAATWLDGSPASAWLTQATDQSSDPPEATTFALAPDHPGAWAATDSSVRLAQALGTRHRLISAEEPAVVLLADSVAGGELPGDLREVYLSRLARGVSATGVDALVCAVGSALLTAGGMGGWLSRLRAILIPESHVRERLRRCRTTELVFGRAGLAAAEAEHEDGRERLAGPGASARLLRLADALRTWSASATHVLTGGCEPLLPFLDERLLRCAVRGDRAWAAVRRQTMSRPAAHVRTCSADYDGILTSWLRADAPLGALAAGLGEFDFLDAAARRRLMAEAGGSLFTLLALDQWRKRFADLPVAPDQPPLKASPAHSCRNTVVGPALGERGTPVPRFGQSGH